MSQHVRKLLSAYLDGELPVSEFVLVETHIESCLECKAELQALQKLKSTLQNPKLYHKASPELHKRMQEKCESRREIISPRFFSFAAALAVVCVSLFLGYQYRGGTQDTLTQAIVDSHLRSLTAGHLFDVESTDQHTVKPWFSGKLDFAPIVKDLASVGFPLVGGRLDILDGVIVAALIYKRNGHIINLYQRPRSVRSMPVSRTIKGYNLEIWTESDLEFFVISDLNSTELNTFIESFKK